MKLTGGKLGAIGAVLVLAVLIFVVWFVIWAAGCWVLERGFGVGTVGFSVWGVIAAFLVLVLIAGAFEKMEGHWRRGEMVTRAFFDLFEEERVERLRREIGALPTFGVWYHVLATAGLAVAAFIAAAFIPYGFFLAFVFLALIGYLWFARSRAIRLAVAFYEGNRLLAQGRVEDALFIAETMQKVKKNSAGALWLKANALFAMGRYSEAADTYQKAVRMNPRLRGVLLPYLALALHRMGLVQNAIRAYREALEENPDAPDAHYGLACALAAANQPDDAVRHLRRAVELGFVSPELLQSDEDLAPLRREPEFKKLLAALHENT